MYIVHVAEIDITPESGMGRVEWYWKQAFENAGYIFLHIGLKEVGPLRHPSLFPYKAYKYFKKLNIKPVAFIVHEPAAGFFVKKGIPCFVESHGVERRYWEALKNNTIPGETKPGFKRRLLFPLWRLSVCDKGLAKASKLLLINNEDAEYVYKKYKRNKKDVFIFKNGVIPVLAKTESVHRPFTVIFNGSWIPRKGIFTFIEAAIKLSKKNLPIRYLVVGTSFTEDTVRADWPIFLQEQLDVLPKFAASQEGDLLASSDLFILPSFFEGQPLSLLQAMAAGKCCVATNCCGQKDIIVHEENGLLFTPGDSNELANIIERCFFDKATKERIGVNAAQSVENRLWEKTASDLVEYIKNELTMMSSPA